MIKYAKISLCDRFCLILLKNLFKNLLLLKQNKTKNLQQPPQKKPQTVQVFVMQNGNALLVSVCAHSFSTTFLSSVTRNIAYDHEYSYFFLPVAQGAFWWYLSFVEKVLSIYAVLP